MWWSFLKLDRTFLQVLCFSNVDTFNVIGFKDRFSVCGIEYAKKKKRRRRNKTKKLFHKNEGN